MERKEKKADLEQLLNSLVKAGWKPRGYEMQGIHCSKNRFTLYLPNMIQGNYSIRDLVSKSSRLWQFVCENGMRPKRVGYAEHYWQRDHHTNGERMIMESDPEYRIIESALKDESELEDFLLNSIKLD